MTTRAHGGGKRGVDSGNAPGTVMVAAAATLQHQDEKAIAKLLAATGVSSHDPRVVSQLVERMRKYANAILFDAKDYANHAGRSSITMEDVRLAVRQNQESSAAITPQRDDLIQLAGEVNRRPLLPLPEVYGLHLPPPQYRMTAALVQLVPEKEEVEEGQRGLREGGEEGSTVADSSRDHHRQRGARQIPMAGPFLMVEANKKKTSGHSPR